MSSRVVYMDEGIVHLTLVGPQTLADYRSHTQAALELARSKKVELFLVDDRQARNRATVLELFGLPAMYEELGAPRSGKVAVVMTEGTPSEADIRFFETVCVNRGWNVRVFTAQPPAIEWLLGKR